ncbi:hypothetical protein [Mesorhizobium sp. M0276]|uniref:hypothetical protein n=1 Tax=Mesorhizobium sp. M0276 TaxID=2956928 RepID=UPI003339DB4F
MELVTHKKFKNGRLMPWGKGTVVTGAKGFVYFAETRQPPTITIQPAKGEVASLAMRRHSGAKF